MACTRLTGTKRARSGVEPPPVGPRPTAPAWRDGAEVAGAEIIPWVVRPPDRAHFSSLVDPPRRTRSTQQMRRRERYVPRTAWGRGQHLEHRPHDRAGMFSLFLGYINQLGLAATFTGDSVRPNWRGSLYSERDGDEMFSRFFVAKQQEGWTAGTPQQTRWCSPWSGDPWLYDRFVEMQRDYPHGAARAAYRRRVHHLIHHHVTVKRAIAQAAEGFFRRHVGDAPCIAVHYRATDKTSEFESGQYVALTAYAGHVDALLALRGPKAKVFVASDAEEAVAYFRRRYGPRVVAQEVTRSRRVAGAPIHFDPRQGRLKGEEVIREMLLLSMCGDLVHSESNVSIVAYYWGGRARSHFIPS